MRSIWLRLFIAATLLGMVPQQLFAHPMVENALDVVVGQDKIVVDARITMEEVLLASSNGSVEPPRDQWAALAQAHGKYLLEHLRVRVDGQAIRGSVTSLPFEKTPPSGTRTELAPYRLEYSLTVPPHTVLIDHSLLREVPQWTASCILRIRQSDQPTFDTDLLPREKSAEFDCEWTAGPPAPAVAATQTNLRLRSTMLKFAREGTMHILTGYDHLLFVTALVLAATRLWDLIKVVTAFTIAHTLTLTLSILGIVSVTERQADPIIAASIVIVAVQNIFWPRQSRGWARLVVAFVFGLFHGLGYAGGLRDAMSELPRVALWAGLFAFTVGVEFGHQVVLLPSYALLSAARRCSGQVPQAIMNRRLLKYGSCAVAAGGVYFFIYAIQSWRAGV